MQQPDDAGGVVLAGVVLMNLILAVGFVVTYAPDALRWLGLAGCFALAFGLGWLGVVLVEYLAGEEDDLG
jgi:hypothetical protein